MKTVAINAEDIAGTILEEIFQITEEDISRAQKTVLEQSAQTAVRDGEKRIGAMNDLEKKIFSLLNKKAEYAKGIEPNESNHRQVLSELKGIKKDAELLKDLLASQLKKRLKLNGDSVIVRDDFQIVALKGNDGEDCAHCEIRDICPGAHD